MRPHRHPTSSFQMGWHQGQRVAEGRRAGVSVTLHSVPKDSYFLKTKSCSLSPPPNTHTVAPGKNPTVTAKDRLVTWASQGPRGLGVSSREELWVVSLWIPEGMPRGVRALPWV